VHNSLSFNASACTPNFDSFVVLWVLCVKFKRSSTVCIELVYNTCHCKKKSWLFCGYPGCRQTGETVVMRDLLCMMLKTNCTRQPQSYFPVHLATTIHALKSLITAVLTSPGYNFLTATLKCICNDSFTDVLRVVSVLWL